MRVEAVGEQAFLSISTTSSDCIPLGLPLDGRQKDALEVVVEVVGIGFSVPPIAASASSHVLLAHPSDG